MIVFTTIGVLVAAPIASSFIFAVIYELTGWHPNGKNLEWYER